MFEHRLLLLTETFPPSVGGIQAYLSGLWGALPPKDSFVIASPQDGAPAWDAQQPYRTQRVPMRAWAYPRWRPAWQVAREVLTKENIEAVVCGKALFEGRAALRLKEEFKIPYVVCTYAMEIETWRRHPRTRQQLLAVLEGADRVLTINDHTKATLLTLGVSEKKLVKLYPGIREEYFSAPNDRDAFCSRFRLTGKRIVVTVARFVPRKGMHILLDAFALVRKTVPNAHWVLIGDGPEREMLEQRVREHGIHDAVTILRDASHDDVRRALAVADIFALTPRELPDDPEGFGIVYVEAAAAGVPAVGSRTGGVPEAVRDKETGILVPPNDVHATAEAMRELLTDDARRKALGAAARARAEKEFHWKGRALVFQGMMHSLLTEKAPSPKSQAPTTHA
ncbi:MAG: group 1 glycosyl transferase [Parcubacteria group bacterium Gr01-1014_106]|nr:MAG: group 1 glycosyl transferase [Parcubacteria group bacterium Gr01-1014_106]